MGSDQTSLMHRVLLSTSRSNLILHLSCILLRTYSLTAPAFAVAPSSCSHLSFPSKALMDLDVRAYNEYASAAVEFAFGHVNRNGIFSAIRSVRDVDNNSRRQYLYSVMLNEDAPLIPPVELPSNIKARIPSPSGEKVAIFRESSNSKGKQILEVWENQGCSLKYRIVLPASVHGKVVADEVGFGLPSWSNDENVLVYSAERKAISTTTFFEEDNDEESSGKVNFRGGKYTVGLGLIEHWGEKYSKQSALLDLFCVNVNTGNIGRVENVPGGDQRSTNLASYALGQPIFSPDDKNVVYVAWDAGGGPEMPRRLGLIYCQQRPSKLYLSPIQNLLNRIAYMDGVVDEELKQEQCIVDSGFTVLVPDHRFSRSPRFSPPDSSGNRHLVFLSSKKGFDTHSGCFGLYALPWVQESGRFDLSHERTIVDQVNDPRDSPKDCGIVSGLNFPGLFLQTMQQNCFLSSNELVLTTQWGSWLKMVKICIEEKSLHLIEYGSSDTSSELVCVGKDGDLIATIKSPNQPEVLVRMNIRKGYGPTKVCEPLPIAVSSFSLVGKDQNFGFDFSIRVLEKAPSVDGVAFDAPIQSILLLPDKSKNPRPPLIVVPHGGPHAASGAVYLPSYAFLCGCGGYAILLVNYRGSIGFGQASIESLPTNIGSLDVADVVAATVDVRDSGLVDPQRIGICGGSHGGFLTAHCTGQHPELFRTAAMRNPVVNIASMVTATDIPDWCYVETGGTYNWKEYRPPNGVDIQHMYEKSPIRYAKAVTAPTLVALGLKDLRVPPSQGLEWYHSLRSRGVPTRLLQYEDDDHAIGGVVSEADHWINIKHWFDEHLH